MTSGHIIGTASTYNSQVKCGDDVITRIVYATERNGLKELQDLVVGNINTMLAELAEKNKVPQAMIDYIVVAGNTTMMHLFYGIDPAAHPRGALYPDRHLFPAHPRQERGPAGRSPGHHLLHAERGKLRGRRHHLRRARVADPQAGQGLALHRHRHERRDRAREQGLARDRGMLGGPGLRGERHQVRHARHGRGHRRGRDRSENVRGELPRHRRLETHRHLRLGHDRHPRRDVSERRDRSEGKDPGRDRVQAHPPRARAAWSS